MSEADALADLLGKRPAGVPPSAGSVPAPLPIAAKTTSIVRDLILAAVSLGALMGWLTAATWIIEALTTGGTITDIVTLEIAATFIIFGGLFAIAALLKFFVTLPAPAQRTAIATAIGLGLAVGVLGQSYAVFATWLANHLAPPINPVSGATALMLIGGSGLILFQTASEEFFFRGWLQPVLAKHFGAVAGIGGAAVAFSLLHVYGGASDPVSMVNLALGGIVFGLLAWRTGGLAAPMAAHFAWNWSEIVLFGLSPNPGIATFGAITDYDIVGSALWGGSEEGLNASLAISFVLAAVALALIRWHRSEPVA